MMSQNIFVLTRIEQCNLGLRLCSLQFGADSISERCSYISNHESDKIRDMRKLTPTIYEIVIATWDGTLYFLCECS